MLVTDLVCSSFPYCTPNMTGSILYDLYLENEMNQRKFHNILDTTLKGPSSLGKNDNDDAFDISSDVAHELLPDFKALSLEFKERLPASKKVLNTGSPAYVCHEKLSSDVSQSLEPTEASDNTQLSSPVQNIGTHSHSEICIGIYAIENVLS